MGRGARHAGRVRRRLTRKPTRRISSARCHRGGPPELPLQGTMAVTGYRSVDVVAGYFQAGAAQTSALARMMDSSKKKVSSAEGD